MARRPILSRRCAGTGLVATLVMVMTLPGCTATRSVHSTGESTSGGVAAAPPPISATQSAVSRSGIPSRDYDCADTRSTGATDSAGDSWLSAGPLRLTELASKADVPLASRVGLRLNLNYPAYFRKVPIVASSFSGTVTLTVRQPDQFFAYPGNAVWTSGGSGVDLDSSTARRIVVEGCKDSDIQMLGGVVAKGPHECLIIDVSSGDSRSVLRVRMDGGSC